MFGIGFTAHQLFLAYSSLNGSHGSKGLTFDIESVKGKLENARD